MSHESQRDTVCDRYAVYLGNKMKKGKDLAFISEINRIVELAKEYDITLLCWCAPKRCHADSLKRYIETLLDIIYAKNGLYYERC